MADVFQCFLQNGRIEVGFLGGAQIDRYGQHQHDRGRRLRPPHGASAGQRRRGGDRHPRAPHGRDQPARAGGRFPRQVDFVTSPGHRMRGRPRRELGMPGAGPVKVVTDKAILEADRDRRDGACRALSRGRHPATCARVWAGRSERAMRSTRSRRRPNRSCICCATCSIPSVCT